MLPFKKILSPVDFSEACCDAMAVANELALHFSSELLVVHVVPDPPVLPESVVLKESDMPLYRKELKSFYKDKITEEIEKHFSKDLKANPIVERGDPANKIIKIAEEENVDLIVISTHGETGLRRVVLGSVAEKVVRHAQCPVITIRTHSKG